MKNIEKTRLCFLHSLVFCLILVSCSNNGSGTDKIILGWEDKQVKKMLVPIKSLPESANNTMYSNLRVQLAKPGAPGILGSYSQDNEFVIFEPLIPFTAGLKYEVLYKDKKIAEIDIPAPEGEKPPQVTAIYPSEDSLPENLLKIYIGFSKPMQEGVSASQVVLIKGGVDTLSDVFLDLQPELWNADRTILTLWLNPGRIKRDLVPNREMGPPLLPGTRYQVLVKPGWRDALGNPISKGFQHNFITIPRDTLIPETYYWNARAPKAGTKHPVIVHLREPLDYLVLKNALKVVDEQMKEIQGSVEITDNEREWRFIPFSEWKKGDYSIQVEPRVEDLAGNNLDRPFERDLAKPAKDTTVQGSSVSFSVMRMIRFTVQ